MTPLTEIKLELFADYFQLYIQDEKAVGDLSDKWTKETSDMLLATADGTIGIGTVRNMVVPVCIKIFAAEPALLTDTENRIGQINECDLEVSTGKIVIAGCTDYFPDAQRIELGNGLYRARIYYGSLDTLSENELEGDDFYEVHLWKTNNAKGVEIIKNRHSN
jgi:hypothetical protein